MFTDVTIRIYTYTRKKYYMKIPKLDEKGCFKYFIISCHCMEANASVYGRTN